MSGGRRERSTVRGVRGGKGDAELRGGVGSTPRRNCADGVRLKEGEMCGVAVCGVGGKRTEGQASGYLTSEGRPLRTWGALCRSVSLGILTKKKSMHPRKRGGKGAIKKVEKRNKKKVKSKSREIGAEDPKVPNGSTNFLKIKGQNCKKKSMPDRGGKITQRKNRNEKPTERATDSPGRACREGRGGE